MPELRNGSWADRCPRTASGYPSSRASRTSERTETARRAGERARARARRVDVRKGKLLAGDSGRKIAEVIDLRGAIYQRGSREEGGETRRTVVCEHSRARAKIPRIRVRWISGKGKRGRVFVRFAKCVPR